MRILSIILVILLISVILTFTGCASTQGDSQLTFGITAAKQNLWDEAIFRWKKVLQQNPDSAAAHNNLAVAYEKKGFWEEAKREYELALKLAPNNRYIQANYNKFKATFLQEESPSSKAENKNAKSKNN
ncbi:MAG: hypothetical protein DRI99_00020 [Candidatus Aminicenantes bacterium]|nr:MAG: hypothetical protein DRI99_00020 [Candidatus Aminicenantes bacterium]HHF42663.1 tetratricopeptide repeat protein [Candidatus Aminicenantes bacterium]